MSGLCLGFRLGVLLWLGSLVPLAQAQDTLPADHPLSALTQIQNAARTLDYAGITVYQQGRSLQAAQLVHWVDGSGERERFETLDGVPRECLRENRSEQCLYPDQRLVVHRTVGADHFPALLQADPGLISQHYEWRPALGTYRVAGRDCMVSELAARDTLRYSYRLCTDLENHLLLRTQTFDQHGHLVDQLAFSRLKLSPDIKPADMASRHDVQGWTVHQEIHRSVDLLAQGWRFALPPGFRPQAEITYQANAGQSVDQLVISDGLAAISIFVETFDPQRDQNLQEGSLRQGAINIYRMRLATYWLTAMGEVPAQTVRDVVHAAQYVSKTVR
ncbi:MucB/RseB C-terminal domain-containing protein [Castellaniella sp.]|uniref:MucB/RseB C-terminal domain-containing protein n=1 Tax=Castellaniella sp. TaxID=1955812 RepID=UPI003560D323